MLLFPLVLKPGIPIYEQIVFGIKKAIIAGQLKEGEPVSSVRELSKELRISPITVHKAIAQLVREGLLEVRVGIGTVVAASSEVDPKRKTNLLGNEISRLVVEAKSIGIHKDEFMKSIEKAW